MGGWMGQTVIGNGVVCLASDVVGFKAMGLMWAPLGWMLVLVSLASGGLLAPSVGEVWSQADWDPVWSRPNPTVPVLVWDFPKNVGPLGLQSGQSHIG